MNWMDKILQEVFRHGYEFATEFPNEDISKVTDSCVAAHKSEITKALEIAEVKGRREELETLQILDFEPDEPEIEAKYPTMNFDEYIEDRLQTLETKLKDLENSGE